MAVGFADAGGGRSGRGGGVSGGSRVGLRPSGGVSRRVRAGVKMSHGLPVSNQPDIKLWGGQGMLRPIFCRTAVYGTRFSATPFSVTPVVSEETNERNSDGALGRQTLRSNRSGTEGHFRGFVAGEGGPGRSVSV